MTVNEININNKDYGMPGHDLGFIIIGLGF